MLRTVASRSGARMAAMRRMSTVKMIDSEEAFGELIKQPALSVVYYTATWCG